jgi:protein AroM
MKARVGMVTIGQAPRVDVVPEMADLMGPGVETVERGALDGLTSAQIEALAPREGDGVLVTRLTDGRAVFLGKRAVTPRVQAKIAELEADGVDMIVLLCTGTFQGLLATRPLVEPDKVLLGVLRGVRVAGRLGVVTPSERHVPQTEARWRGYGFDPVVAPASPYGVSEPTAAPRTCADAHGAAAVAGAVSAFRAGGVGLVLLDCMGFRRDAREHLRQAVGVPVVVANLLVARVVAEMVGG